MLYSLRNYDNNKILSEFIQEVGKEEFEAVKEEGSENDSEQKQEPEKPVEREESLPTVYATSSKSSFDDVKSCKSFHSLFPVLSAQSMLGSDKYLSSEHMSDRGEATTSLESSVTEIEIKEEIETPDYKSSGSSMFYYPSRLYSPSESTHKNPPSLSYFDLFKEGFDSLHSFLRLPVDGKVCALMGYAENLIISTNEGEKFNIEDNEKLCADPLIAVYSRPVGCFHLSVKSTNEKFITYCDTHFLKDDVNGGSRIISTIDHCFNLAEELKTETQCNEHGIKEEKSLHVFRELQHFVAYKSVKSNGNIVHKRGVININIPGSFLLDGALFALMRYLVIIKYKGSFKTWSMDILGRRCKCYFDAGMEEFLFINEKYVKTVKIVKTLYKQGVPPEVSVTNLLPVTGNIVRHKWDGCPLFIHLDPSTHLPPTDPGTDIKWEDNIILVSKYLDKKDRLISEMESYLVNHPDIKDMLKDYMMALFQLKPKNVLNFTIDFFLNITK